MNAFAVLAEEKTASIREIQKNPSRVLRGITRVTRGSKTVGFFLANDEFADLVENQQARLSAPYVKRVAKGRRDYKAGKGTPLTAVLKAYGL